VRLEFIGRIDVQPYFWKHEPLTAGTDFQDQIALPFRARSGNHDTVVAYRHKLASAFRNGGGRQTPTGTEFEFEVARRSVGART